MFDWSDVRGFDLRTATTVDQPQARDGASLTVCAEYVFSEVPVAHCPVRQLIDPLPCRRDLERSKLPTRRAAKKGLYDISQSRRNGNMLHVLCNMFPFILCYEELRIRHGNVQRTTEEFCSCEISLA